MQAQKALTRDSEAAFHDRDWNLAFRRAQESAEYAVKCLYLIVGEEPNHTHGLNVNEGLIGKTPVIWFPSGGLPTTLRGGLYVAWNEEHGNQVQVWWLENSIYTLLASSCILESRAALQLCVERGQVEVLAGNKVAAIGWAAGRPVPEGRWAQTPLDDSTIHLINFYTTELAKLRDAAFYFERLFCKEDADRAKDQARLIFVTILQSLGLASIVNKDEEEKIIKGNIFAAPKSPVGHTIPTIDLLSEALEKCACK